VFDGSRTYIVYDGDCVFCSQYVSFLRLKRAVGPVELVNAREPHPAVTYVKSRGVDLNEEMALVIGGEIYSGPDCMHRLALMSTGAGLFNALTARVFARPALARALYPILRAGRNLTLRMLGRTRISA
jgi:predicted DCC family thiol-disulfide oxidoreductase YuxK